MAKKQTSQACPTCAGFADDKRCRPTSFTLNGIKHVAPDMWLAARSTSHGGGVDAVFAAMQDWANHCELERRFESQRAASANIVGISGNETEYQSAYSAA